MKKDYVIIGAGAAGLICAYKIAKESKCSVIVMEKEAIPGKKLKAAGSGKCNITNKAYHWNCFHSNEENLLKEFMNQFSFQDVLQLFDELGIPYYEQNGYYYPLSNQGKQVVALLQKRCEDVGVTFLFNSTVLKVEKADHGYIVHYENEKKQSVSCNGVVFATGGKAAPKLGGSDLGYHLVKALGIKVTKLYPGLSPIYLDDTLLKITKGVRVNGSITIKNKNGFMIKEEGQIQFNQDSVSGICVMNLSSYFYPWIHENQLDSVFLDLIPDFSWDKLKQFLCMQKHQFEEENILDCLNTLLPEALASYILAKCKFEKTTKMKSISEKQINKITSMIKKLDCRFVNKLDYDKAQVTGGGVSLCEISLNSFESNMYPNMYLLGELLDVNGDCGGYNISFAMISAIVAAKDINEKMRNADD